MATPEEVRRKVRVSADPERRLCWLEEDLQLGFAEINLHSICREEQERFIDVFGAHVLPRLAGA